MVSLVAGFLDTLAGGGGLIVIPALLLAQVPPIQAIATNKLQGSFGTLVSAGTMHKNNMVSFTQIKRPFIAALIGAIIGAISIQFVHADVVRIIIPLVLGTIALYFLFAPNPGTYEKPQKISDGTFDAVVAPTIGFYDGAIGPGAGSFYCLSGVALAGKNLINATANAKVLNFASNLAALSVFIISGKIMWLVGGIMVVGTMIGAYLGSLVVIHRGAKVIRPVIVVMSVSMLVSYLWKTYF